MEFDNDNTQASREWRTTHEFDVSAVVEHQVLWLEIAVDDALGVKTGLRSR